MNRWGRVIRHSGQTALVLLLLTALTGCLYPKDRMGQNERPSKESVRSIQDAVDQYFESTGLLPIKNSSEDTPKYEKFVIDIAKLERMGYISDIPAAAFENGGSYYFLLQNEEVDPVVKLMSISVYQQINDLQVKVDAYRESNGGQLPAGGEAYPSFYHLDLGKLTGSKPDIRSVYSNQTMNLIIHENGTVYADYGADIRKAVEMSGTEPSPEEDLRELLVSQSDFVPVKSAAYYWVNGDPEARLPEQ
ncbi:hypothetical protein [Paenibacillus tarimensis]|uniref:hypothetical protein n=1 Tax=Paenibacillus tarimensis TaxID=416012 RepID=UPI001F336CF2|nr:hypothetical protein [Paenibacillus tarimensis]MCF2942534.1 hypothetical protein [Paenibacillus tarimensis]